MTLSINKLQEYAKTTETKVIEGAYKIAPDYKSATFVLESGQKLTMTEDEIDQAIERHKQQSKPFAYIEEAVAAEEKARLKPTAKSKTKGDT